MRTMKKGSRYTAETRANMSAAQKRRHRENPASAETRAKIGAAHRGKIVSQETRAKLSARGCGSWRPGGWHHTEEAKARISAGHKGKIVSEETKARMSEAHKGMKHSKETKAKISISEKMAQRKPETRQKRHRTWLSNGNMSRGQRKLYELLLSIGIPFVPECYFNLKSCKAFVDAFIPFNRLIIEYDGHGGHYTEEGQVKDQVRDAKMLQLHGNKTIRIDQKAIFTDVGLNKIGEAVRIMP